MITELLDKLTFINSKVQLSKRSLSSLDKNPVFRVQLSMIVQFLEFDSEKFSFQGKVVNVHFLSSVNISSHAQKFNCTKVQMYKSLVVKSSEVKKFSCQ